MYGSFAQLEADFGRLPLNESGEPDLHRPFIDELTRPNPDDPTGAATMRRIPDVLDVWFDSGSMPYAQVHHPFENADWFEHHFPGDFIVEYVGQTRGWFYVLHVLATALFDRPAFTSVICHGIVLGDDGRKASKSLRNFPDPMRMFDTYGSDAVRWSLMSSPVLRGGNLVVAEENIREAVRQVVLPLWSTYYFFTLYAGAADGGAGYTAKTVTPEHVAGLPPMDRYLLAHTHDLVVSVTAAMETNEIARACALVREHLDVLTNWYVRTQRDRFWAEDDDAFDTLFTGLEVLCRVMAPLAPMVTEEIWRGLTGGRSVHLADWPATLEPVRQAASTTRSDQPGERTSGAGTDWADGVDLVDGFVAKTGQWLRPRPDAALVPDGALTGTIDQVRDAVSTALGLRKAHQVRVRQPLRSLTLAATADLAETARYTDLLAGELNVKRVDLVRDDEETRARFGIARRLAVNARAAGPRLGRGVQAVIRAAKDGHWQELHDGQVVVLVDGEAVELELSEYELTTVVDGQTGTDVAAAVLPGGSGFVVLDLALDDALLAEGYARDVVRAVQDARKAAGLRVSDRIDLHLQVPAGHVAAVEAHRDFVARETLASSVDVLPGDELAVQVARADA